LSYYRSHSLIEKMIDLNLRNPFTFLIQIDPNVIRRKFIKNDEKLYFWLIVFWANSWAKILQGIMKILRLFLEVWQQQKYLESFLGNLKKFWKLWTTNFSRNFLILWDFQNKMKISIFWRFSKKKSKFRYFLDFQEQLFKISTFFGGFSKKKLVKI